MFAFLHLMEAVRFLRPQANDMLQIGLGIGSLPASIERHGITTDSVEIDAQVVRMARQHFGYSPRGQVFVEDARTFLRTTDRKYDIIVHDTFTGGSTPEHLLSREILDRIRSVLRPGGVLALNFVGYQDGPDAEASRSVARTLRAVFPTVRAFRDQPPHEKPQGLANIVFFATDATLDLQIPQATRFENDNCESVLRSFTAWEVLKNVPDGPLVTDAKNPLARLQLPVTEAHFRAMNELLPVEVWLNRP